MLKRLKCGKKAKLSKMTLLPKHLLTYWHFMRKYNKEKAPIKSMRSGKRFSG